MEILHATPADASRIAEIHVESWRVAYASIVSAEYLASLSVEDKKDFWSECITAAASQLLVAKEAGVVQGWLNFGKCRDQPAAENECEVWAFYVAPSLWSTGMGRSLWTDAEAIMRMQGFKSCSLWVFPQNDRAMKFYRSAGFAQDGYPQQTFELGGVQLQEIRLVARLQA